MATGFDNNGLGIRSNGSNWGSANQAYPPGCVCYYALSGGTYFYVYDNGEDGETNHTIDVFAGNGYARNNYAFRLA